MTSPRRTGATDNQGNSLAMVKDEVRKGATGTLLTFVQPYLPMDGFAVKDKVVRFTSFHQHRAGANL